MIRLLAIAVVVALVAGCGGGQDPGLRPDDQHALDKLREAGVDLCRARPVDHYFYFDERASARAAREDIRSRSFRAGVERATEAGWLVLAEKKMVLTESNLARVVAELESLARSHGGEYDGWEAPADP